MSVYAAFQTVKRASFVLIILSRGTEVLANTARVSTAADFQQQVLLGTTHIVITDDIDMTLSPVFNVTSEPEEGGFLDAMISIDSAGESHTRSIVVRRVLHLSREICHDESRNDSS